MEMLFFSRDREAGLSWWEDGWSQIQDNLGRKPVRVCKDLRLGWRFTFQQHNDPKHTARAKMEWFGLKHIHVSECHSPDLNQLENLWQDLKISVHRHSPFNQTKLELFCKEDFSLYMCIAGLGAVIAAQGDFAKFWLRELNTFACHTFQFFIFKNVLKPCIIFLPLHNYAPPCVGLSQKIPLKYM